MIIHSKKEECCCCGACGEVYPKNCIDMQCDNEGFLYPNIDKQNYIFGELCLKVCLHDSRIIMDDDYNYLQKIYMMIPTQLRDKIKLLPNNLSFSGIKKELIKCDLYVVARMHCGINTMTALVFSVLQAYRKKAYGMAKYVYVDSSKVLPLEKIVESVTYSIFDCIELYTKLTTRIPQIRQESYRANQVFEL